MASRVNSAKKRTSAESSINDNPWIRSKGQSRKKQKNEAEISSGEAGVIIDVKQATKQASPPSIGMAVRNNNNTNNPKNGESTTNNDDDNNKDTDITKTNAITNNCLHLRLRETTGSLLEPASGHHHQPTGTLLIHACNAQGTWGAGIALAFKKAFPSAFETYRAHCRDHKDKGAGLVGTALLIAPPSSSGRKDDDVRGGPDGGDGVFVGCLFTSRDKGAKKDSPAQILSATRDAVADLVARVRTWNEGVGGGDGREKVRYWRMCRINRGLFGVEWGRTREVLEAVDGGGVVREVVVVSPHGSDGGGKGKGKEEGKGKGKGAKGDGRGQRGGTGRATRRVSSECRKA